MDMERHGTHEKNTDLEGKVGSDVSEMWALHIQHIKSCDWYCVVNYNFDEHYIYVSISTYPLVIMSSDTVFDTYVGD